MQRKIFLTAIGLLVFSLVLSPLMASSVLAATVTFDADTTLTLPNGISLTVLSGSLVESLIVNDDSTISITVDTDTNITIRSNNVYTFSNYGTKTCVAGSYNQINITNASGNGTFSVSTETACTGSGSGSGGGGGGGTASVVPTGTSVSINSGAAKTESANVTLTLAATNATTMLISNKVDFSDATAWLTYSTSKSWTLTSGLGVKTVYAKFRSSTGGESSVVSDTIELASSSQTSEETVKDISGNAVSSGSLIKKAGSPSLYYVGADGKRYAFPTSDIYYSWYSDFSTVQTVSNEVFSSYTYGGSVKSKPGTKLIQFVDGETPWNILNPKVYAVGSNGELRHITSAMLAATLFGQNWETKIIPVIELLAKEYTFGENIDSETDFNVQNEINSAPTINDNQNL